MKHITTLIPGLIISLICCVSFADPMIMAQTAKHPRSASEPKIELLRPSPFCSQSEVQDILESVHTEKDSHWVYELAQIDNNHIPAYHQLTPHQKAKRCLEEEATNAANIGIFIFKHSEEFKQHLKDQLFTKNIQKESFIDRTMDYLKTKYKVQVTSEIEKKQITDSIRFLGSLQPHDKNLDKCILNCEANSSGAE